MGSKSSKQLQNTDKNPGIEYLGHDKIFIHTNDGHLLEFSMKQKKIVYDFGRILNDGIYDMVRTPDNKS